MWPSVGTGVARVGAGAGAGAHISEFADQQGVADQIWEQPGAPDSHVSDIF